jgi:hypothetical protein
MKQRQARDFVLDWLARTFETNRETILRSIFALRMEKAERHLIEEFRKLINEKMPSLLAKYQQVYDDYTKKKASNTNVPPQEQKKLSLPRKRFEWTEATRHSFEMLVLNRLNYYRQITPKRNLSEEEEKNKRVEYLREYFARDLLGLWPDSWMQMNVLLNLSSQIKYPNSSNNSSKQQTQQPSNLRKSTSSLNQNPSSLVSPNKGSSSGLRTNLNHSLTTAEHQRTKPTAINSETITSKNGKTTKLEPQTSTNHNKNTQNLKPQNVLQKVNNGPLSVNNTTNMTLSSKQQHQQLSNNTNNITINDLSNKTKQNVYDNVINQYKRESPSNSM